MNSSSSKPNESFLSDLTDSRKKGEWKSRYEKEALVEIEKEKRYLIILLATSFLLTILWGLYFNNCFFSSPCNIKNLEPYGYSIFGGLMGGTIFSMKWLVHGVAKCTWNIDRHLWRTLTPYLSATVALLIVVLLNVDIFNSEVGHSYTPCKSFGIGFLAGYFSDNAIGKLTEIAQVIFGGSSSKRN
nr:hypothetical protein [uncultured Draconibacterium sp.]